MIPTLCITWKHREIQIQLNGMIKIPTSVTLADTQPKGKEVPFRYGGDLVYHRNKCLLFLYLVLHWQNFALKKVYCSGFVKPFLYPVSLQKYLSVILGLKIF